MAEKVAVCRAQLTRLLWLILELRPNRFPNAVELATTCEVSRRTIYRDLETLAAAGVPVRFEPGRRGYCVAPGFFLEPSKLEEREALALAFHAFLPDRETGTLLGREARRGLIKILQGLPDELRARITAVVACMESPGAEDTNPALNCEPLHELIDALQRGRQIRVWYRNGELPAPIVCDEMESYRLAFRGSGWSLVGRSRGKPATIAISMASLVRVEAKKLASLPTFRIRTIASGSTSGMRSESEPDTFEVRLLVFQTNLPGPDLSLWPDPVRTLVRDDDSVELTLHLVSREGWPARILSQGDSLEVLAPRWLREAVRDLALRIARSNSDLTEKPHGISRLGAVGS